MHQGGPILLPAHKQQSRCIKISATPTGNLGYDNYMLLDEEVMITATIFQWGQEEHKIKLQKKINK